METGSVPKCVGRYWIHCLFHCPITFFLWAFVCLSFSMTAHFTPCNVSLPYSFSLTMESSPYDFILLVVCCSPIASLQPLPNLSDSALSLPAPHSSWFPVHTPAREKLTGQPCFSHIWSQPQSLGNFEICFLWFGGHSLMECTVVNQGSRSPLLKEIQRKATKGLQLWLSKQRTCALHEIQGGGQKCSNWSEQKGKQMASKCQEGEWYF